MADYSPSDEFKTRLTTARRFRDAARPYIKEVLSFCCPGRETDFDRSPMSTQETETEHFTSLPEELATDLAGDLVTYYTPAESKWLDIEAMEADLDSVPEVLELLSEREDDIRGLIEASNYYDIAPQWGFEASSHGTPALWVQKAHSTQPLHFEVVQPNELLIVPGHLGILDRFRETTVPASTLQALFADWPVDLSEPNLQAKIRKASQTVKVCWGFWVDWSDAGNPQWKAQVTADGKAIMAPQPIGPLAGPCPLIVGRFNPQARKPWGRGPGWKALPDMRVLDKIIEVTLAGLDQSIMNTIIYPDDGFLDLSEGIEGGRAYPASRNFTKDSVYDLSRNVNVDQGFYSEERFEAKLRSAFYQDGPRQRGETPPTAAQWVDERRRVQQRLGKPSAPLWTELIAPMIQRVEWLAEREGIIRGAITLNSKQINTKPVSPLQKAQNQDQVMVAQSNLNLAATVMADQAGTVVDLVETFKNIVKKSGDELTVIRKEQAPVDPAAPAQ